MQRSVLHLTRGLSLAARPAVSRSSVPLLFGRFYAKIDGNPVHERLDKLVKTNDVVVFMKGVPERPQCGFSRAVVQILDAQGLDSYAHVNVLEDDDARQGAKEFSSWPTFPQVYVKGEFVGGYDIVFEMFKKGELEKLLIEKGILHYVPTESKPESKQ